MAGVQTRKAFSPFSASNIQQKPLFTNPGPNKLSDLSKLQAILESSVPAEPLISARRPVNASPVVVESRASVPNSVRQMTLFLQLPAQRPAVEDEQEEEEFGELSTATMSTKYSSCPLAEAESILPKGSNAMPEVNRRDSGFWAEVGAETISHKRTSFLAVHEESDSDWEAASDDEEEEEETLLPWDM